MAIQEATELKKCEREIAHAIAKYAKKNPNFLKSAQTFCVVGLSETSKKGGYPHNVGEMFLDSIKEAEEILKYQN